MPKSFQDGESKGNGDGGLTYIYNNIRWKRDREKKRGGEERVKGEGKGGLGGRGILQNMHLDFLSPFWPLEPV